ncbi:MAG TPA: hypothetical protein VF281_00035 [Candidatus Saccharimonadales bacterium]
METGFTSREAAQKERKFSLGWMIGILGLGIVATLILCVVYANPDSTADLQRILLVPILMLLSACGFMVTMLWIGLNDTNKWLKNERDKT